MLLIFSLIDPKTKTDYNHVFQFENEVYLKFIWDDTETKS